MFMPISSSPLYFFPAQRLVIPTFKAWLHSSVKPFCKYFHRYIKRHVSIETVNLIKLTGKMIIHLLSLPKHIILNHSI